MTSRALARYQDDFVRAMLDPACDAAPARFDAETKRRFRVYRNNVQHGLSEALAAAYPSVRRLVGEAFFKEMARLFVVRHPPRVRSLALFGEGFAAFIEGFPAAASVPYLGDLARLERARLEALHSADAAVVSPAAVVDLGEAIDRARFEAHPATRVVISRHPVVAIWQAQQSDDLEDAIVARAETALVTRPADQVRVRALDAATGTFVQTLFNGERPTRALANALVVDRGFEPLRAFEHLLAAGAVAAISVPPEPDQEPDR